MKLVSYPPLTFADLGTDSCHEVTWKSLSAGQVVRVWLVKDK